MLCFAIRARRWSTRPPRARGDRPCFDLDAQLRVVFGVPRCIVPSGVREHARWAQGEVDAVVRVAVDPQRRLVPRDEWLKIRREHRVQGVALEPRHNGLRCWRVVRDDYCGRTVALGVGELILDERVLLGVAPGRFVCGEPFRATAVRDPAVKVGDPESRAVRARLARDPIEQKVGPQRRPDEVVNDWIDEAVLALLRLGIFERYPVTGAGTWKSFDWEAMDRLHGKRLIADPASKARSVRLTETGLRQAEAVFRRLFEADDQATCDADAVTAASPDAPRR